MKQEVSYEEEEMGTTLMADQSVYENSINVELMDHDLWEKFYLKVSFNHLNQHNSKSHINMGSSIYDNHFSIYQVLFYIFSSTAK